MLQFFQKRYKIISHSILQHILNLSPKNLTKMLEQLRSMLEYADHTQQALISLEYLRSIIIQKPYLSYKSTINLSSHLL
ncbi:hypothetical protein CAEBREN_19691 [Caenorhabditis brenneri]|uniref:Uncharacterized protein n=1 Tax=Caenorhabditis brenneri TaxID=135651 RepID=G0NYL9_CAEBE|nr:hypothetical protein CAEBREN_19691 [Caenorhabditis brenneri]